MSRNGKQTAKKQKAKNSPPRSGAETARAATAQPRGPGSRAPKLSNARAAHTPTKTEGGDTPRKGARKLDRVHAEQDRAVSAGGAVIAAADGNRTALAAPQAPDPRLPPVGTALIKRDRHGTVRCEALVEAGGIRYREQVYPSISAAASAAAADLGLNGSVNGWVFWSLSKPARAAVKPADRLRNMAARYEERVAAMLRQPASDGVIDGVRQEVEAHAARLREILSAAA